jgi:hypothetical protein
LEITMNIIPFEGSKSLPAYLKNFNVDELNADLLAHAGAGFPVLSIKGKNFSVVRAGERVVLPNPKDPDSPATSVDVVIIKASRAVSKVFYLKGYDPESSEKQKPDCYSSDGIAPAADAKTPQSKSCATCKHAQWGSKITEAGKKAKACADSVRLAVAAAGALNDPMLLRVPPATISGLGEYGQLLNKRGVAYNMVVTKMSFDKEAESPKLVFRAVGFLDDAGFAEVNEVAAGDTVRNILGGMLGPAFDSLATADLEETAPATAVDVVTQAAITKAKAVTPAAVEAAVEAATAPSKPAKPAAAKNAFVATSDPDLDISGISFDD